MADAHLTCIGRDRVAVEDIRAARDALLASDTFHKSPRMSRLLAYLVERAITDCARDTSEYAIGIGVFDRDPLHYSPGEDPVVRVQVGRLRTKLKNHYAAPECLACLEIVVPLGSYMPVFQRRRAPALNRPDAGAFAVSPFKCVSADAHGEYFALGLHEELTHLLYKNLGRRIIIEHGSERALEDKSCHRLEGSVHVDAERVRTCVRVIEVQSGCLAWSEQFDGAAHLALTHQQAMALSICDALQAFLNAPTHSAQALR